MAFVERHSHAAVANSKICIKASLKLELQLCQSEWVQSQRRPSSMWYLNRPGEEKGFLTCVLEFKVQASTLLCLASPGMGTSVVQSLWPSGTRVKTLAMPLNTWSLQVKFFDLYGLDLFGTRQLIWILPSSQTLTEESLHLHTAADSWLNFWENLRFRGRARQKSKSQSHQESHTGAAAKLSALQPFCLKTNYEGKKGDHAEGILCISFLLRASSFESKHFFHIEEMQQPCQSVISHDKLIH